MKIWRLLFVSTSVLALASCGEDDEDKGKLEAFGAPNVGEIVEAAAPTGLKAAGQNLTQYGLTCETCGTSSGFLDYVKATVFQKSSDPMIAGTNYYRYWVDVTDAALAELNERISGAEEDSPMGTCLKATPVEVDFTKAIGGASITTTAMLQCWEEQTTPNGSQDLAFGKDGDDYWIVYRTKDDGQTSGSGFRIVIAKATADGNQADIWFTGGSYQTVPGETTANYSGNFQRIFANKADNTFTFNSASDTVVFGLPFSSFYGRSNGSDLYMEARTFGVSTQEYVDVTGMEPGTGLCTSADDIESTSTGCDSIKATPSGFGYAAPLHSASYSRSGTTVPAGVNTSALITSLEAIEAIDYDTLGVGNMTVTESATDN